MPRQSRFVIPGQPQHVIQRGNNREDIFRAEGDYHFYLEKRAEAAKKRKCDLHTYVLMTNHVHLLVTPRQDHSIGKMMQSVGRYYVQYFNHNYHCTGTLWEGRYKATLIDTEQYLLTCMRYIELNPVRANNMAKHPSGYPWSSYRYNALGQSNHWVTPHREYKRLGWKAKDRQAAHRQLFRAHIPAMMLVAIREATNKAWVLGTQVSEFKYSKNPHLNC